MASNVTFVPNQGAITAMLKSPNGFVGQTIQKIGNHTLREAHKTVPVERSRFSKDHPPGYLKANLRITLWPGINLEMQVGAVTSYATFVHQGAKPHKITARPPKLLTFPGKGGKIVAVQSVNHPGNKPNPFLWKALLVAMRPYR